ncbi:hypothetical protein GGI24_004825, partial [Coemansia furcata]
MLTDSCITDEPKTWKELEDHVHKLWPIANSTHKVRLHLNEFKLNTTQHFSVYMTEFDHMCKFAEIDEYSRDAWHYFMQGLPPMLQVLTCSFAMCKKLQPGTSSVKELYIYANGAGSTFAMLQRQLQATKPMLTGLATTPNFNRSLQFSEPLDHDKGTQQAIANRSQVRQQGFGQASGTTAGQPQQPRGNQSYYRPANQEAQRPFQRGDQPRGNRPMINQVETSEDVPANEELAMEEALDNGAEDLDDVVQAREIAVFDDWVPELDEEDAAFFLSVSAESVQEQVDWIPDLDEERVEFFSADGVTS